ncbi:hypothetical protein [Hamadaea tsunoensis]|uniref:hypothetical protein n=1 Tax=Hamadaea tsunoensis TaxID=53368 RepID=UPI00040551A6|nr:hypothetical protein [Hamadaea tsunoensis]
MSARLLPPARRNAALTGAAAGVVGVAALSVLAAVGLRPHAPPPVVGAPSAGPTRLRTAQLEGSVLAASSRPAASPPPVRRKPVTSPCERLIAAPDEVLSWLHPGASPSPGPGRATQILLGGGAEEAVTKLRQTAEACRSFTARRPDGSRVRVRLTAVDAGDLLLGEAYTVRMTIDGDDAGFLAVGRVGDVVSVLRAGGPETGHSLPDLQRDLHDLLDGTLRDVLGTGAGNLADTGHPTESRSPLR